MKIHFNAMGKGLYIPKSAECGQNNGAVRLDQLTADPAKVTCERCKKTAAYRKAVSNPSEATA